MLLNEVDYAIFAELQRDGRLPFTTIAQRLGVSEAHVRRRVKRLTEADVFSIAAVADPRVLGLECMAWIGLVVRQSATRAVADRLVELPEVDYVVVSTGEFNVMCEVACRSTRDLYRLLLRLRAFPGVRKTETFLYLNLFRQQFQWLVNGAGSGDSISLGVAGAVTDESTIHPLDIAIIGELQRDGRAPFRNIARRLGVSERIVSARFSDLVARNLVRVIAVGNPLTLGFRAMAWLGIEVSDGAKYEQVASALSNVKGIDYVVMTAGRYDLMAELVCRDQDELLRRLETDIGAIAGIGHVETFFYLRLLYRSTAGAWGAARSLAGDYGAENRRR